MGGGKAVGNVGCEGMGVRDARTDHSEEDMKIT